ncbi:hypothetical protein GCM10020366_52930 [Saccharopolyspora gregorii]|uniref:Uncharacterized protein n=1 Tax=Saccharopolyspora gregorii TaxID=33914 RepID=A0ABP6RXT4_9PSEU
MIGVGVPAGELSVVAHTTQGARLRFSASGSESGAPGMPIGVARATPCNEFCDTSLTCGPPVELFAASSADE